MIRLISILSMLFFSSMANYAVRVKDIAHIKGVRSNQLIGYGVVIGLQGTGDSAATAITNQSMNTMMNKIGAADAANLPPGSTASVLVTAELPAFSEIEEKINVKVSILGDAADLSGGQLLMTPLKGLDEVVYALATGDIGRNQDGTPISVTTITNGAQIEKTFHYSRKKWLNVSCIEKS